MSKTPTKNRLVPLDKSAGIKFVGLAGRTSSVVLHLNRKTTLRRAPVLVADVSSTGRGKVTPDCVSASAYAPRLEHPRIAAYPRVRVM